MCGIVGLVPREPADPAELDAAVRRMAAAIVHRGPDEDGFHVTPHVALGVRRLSIIDVAGAHQPIFTPDRSRAVVFNGEIYNYRDLRRALLDAGRRLSTVGDTEVVLHAVDAWGEQGIRRLEGMFAFAVWDERRRELLVARDWFGQKSVYWAATPLGWAFASEIKALFASGLVAPRLDLETLSHYMSLRYLPGERTLFEGVGKLPAASLMRVGAAGRRLERLWTPRYAPKFEGTEHELLDELDATMASVVSEHLMSEVPLGAFLSGGIDSSLVVAYAARAAGRPLATFSIGVDQASQSELPWARRVVARYGTEHVERVIQPDLARSAPVMTAALEEPVDPFAAGVYLVSQITSERVTVALGGDGGDELFAGYDRYVGQQLAETYARVPAALRRRLLRPAFSLVPESFGYKSLATRLRWLDRMAELDGVARYAEAAAFLRFPHALKSRLFAQQAWDRVGRLESERLLEAFFADGAAEAFVDRMLHTDCSTRLAEHQLPIVDRMAMAHSLEARSPFLDRRVAGLAMRIPAAWQMKRRRIKYITRKLGERYLPRDLLYRKKQGFGFPLALWLRGELRPLIQRTVDDSRLVAAGIFRREEMQRLVDEHVGGGVDHNYRLWLLYNLELWYRHWIDGESVARLEDWIDRAKAGRAGLRPAETAGPPEPATTRETHPLPGH